jgi:predicted kinase
MCYKRMMQGMKRRRRRKPNRAENKGEQPAPLQPNYPEADSGDAGEDEGPAEVASSAVEAESAAAPAAAAPPQRKKRRRGGRGRKPQPQVTPPAGDVDSGEDEDAGEQPELPSASPEAPEHVGVPPAAPHAAAHAAHGHKKQPKGTVVLTIGLPGSGKTSWFRRRAITPLSSDLLRMMLFDDISEQRYQDLVFSTLRYLLRARMIARMPWNYVDATNLSPRERRGWIKMAQEFGYEVHAVFFDVPVEVCAERNLRRGRMVPDDVMQRMAGKLRPPTFEEGFTKITVVRVKKQTKTAEAENVIQREEEAQGRAEIDDNY